MTNNLKSNMTRYIDAGFPILYLNLFEESKADEIIRSVADRRIIKQWSSAGGYSEYVPHKKEYLVSQSREAIEGILRLKAADEDELKRSLLVIKDAHIVLDNKDNVAALKEIALKISEETECTVILMSPILVIPPEIEKYITILEMDHQKFEDIRKRITDFAEEQGVTVLDKTLDEMAMAFKGLSEFEISNLLALAYSDGGELQRSNIRLIFEQKQQMIRKAGILEMIPVKETVADIGGLENLKEWLEKKATVIKDINSAAEFGVDTPKGVLIAGVPGCGKSLNAKAAASLFEVPLLKMDMGRLMGKYLGESEGNMRKAIALAEAIAPCVLWVDELDKAFAGTGGSGGGHEVTTRLLGNFLTWMQEKTSAVFVVATANNIDKLPPELLRKGRFDEIFYVELPKDEERKKIFEIHINKRRPSDLNGIDLGTLVAQTKDYSGADIEGVVREAVEDTFVAKKPALTTDALLHAIENTHPLSEIMKERLAEMSKAYESGKFKKASR